MITKVLLVMFLGQLCVCSLGASSIVYQKLKVGSVVGHTVTINLGDPEVKVSVALARGGTGDSESFKSIVNRTRPVAAITGTFFDTKTLIPTGDIALFGTVVHSGCIGSALCIDADNNASIVPLKTGRAKSWAGYETVLCAGPTLVADGKPAVALKHEGFRNSLLTPARRTAVGITKSGKLMFAAVNRNASLYDVAKMLVKLNVVNALCLDGGSSTGLYCSGSYYAVPSRTLTNCLVVYSSVAGYQQAKTVLAPPKLLAAKSDNKEDIARIASTQTDYLSFPRSWDSIRPEYTDTSIPRISAVRD